MGLWEPENLTKLKIWPFHILLLNFHLSENKCKKKKNRFNLLHPSLYQWPDLWKQYCEHIACNYLSMRNLLILIFHYCGAFNLFGSISTGLLMRSFSQLSSNLSCGEDTQAEDYNVIRLYIEQNTTFKLTTSNYRSLNPLFLCVR